MAYESKIANELLYSPVDKMAHVDEAISQKLGIKEYFEKCYVEPRFDKGDKPEVKESDELDMVGDYHVSHSQVVDQIEREKKDFENFERWLNNKDNFSVATISGNAGTGKTTFIYKLERDYSEKKWIVLDLTKATNRIQWIGDHVTSIDHFEKPYSKVYYIIVHYICSMVFRELDEEGVVDLGKVRGNIKRFSDTYKEQFAKYQPEGRTFFNQIVEKEKGCTSDEECVFQVAGLFKEYFDGKAVEDETNRKIEEALNVMLMMIRCLGYDEKDGRNVVIVFDNFERFIARAEIFNADVNNIRKRLNNYLNFHRRCTKAPFFDAKSGKSLDI